MSGDSNPPSRTSDSPSNTEDEEHYRQQLYQIMSAPALTPEEKRQQLLELGQERLGVENGHIVKIDQQANRHEIILASGSDIVQAGDVTPLEQTYCRKTISTETILTLSNAYEEGWGDDPATDMWNIGCYIGNKLLVRGELFGTLCFVNKEPRAEQFTLPEQSFVTLLTSSISRLIERDYFEQELQRKQEWIHLFVTEVTDYAIVMIDPAGYIVSWNEGAQRITGYTADEIIDEHVARLYTIEDRNSGRPERLLEQARQMGRVEEEGWCIRKHGSPYWAIVSILTLYDGDGTLCGFGKVIRDVTERRTLQQELEAEKEFIDRALDSLDELFFVLTPKGDIERVNQRVLEVTGYSEEDVLSMNPADFFIPEDQHAIIEGIAKVLDTGESTVEASLLTKDNRQRRYEFRVRRLTDDVGSVTGIVGIGRDITERTLTRERLEVAQRVLRHNIRNELTAIRGWTEVIGETATESKQEAVNRILATIDRLVDLSEKIYQMTTLNIHGGASPLISNVPVRVPELIADVQRTYPDATIELDPPRVDELQVACDERFDTAIRNAIENAIEHNPTGDPWVRVVIEHEQDNVRIRIHDNGPGIPEMEQQVLEDGMETPLKHGSGVGLWLIHWCVTTAGGQITFDERKPRGSTITLTFPVYDGQ